MNVNYSTWSNLPGSLLLRIFQFLDNDADLCRVAQVCRNWHDVAEDPSLREYVTIDTGWHSLVEESLAALPKRCPKLATLDIKQVPDDCIQGLLASFVSNCPDLQELALGLIAPPLHDYTLCIISLSSLRSLCLDCALLSSEYSYEALSSINTLENVTFTAADSSQPYELMIGLQIFFMRCQSPLCRISLPDVAPLSNSEISQSLIQVIFDNYRSTLTHLFMWPVKTSARVLESLCRVQNLENVNIFEAKLSSLSNSQWTKLNDRIQQCRNISISQTSISSETLKRFSQQYTSITEFLCLSCEFEDDDCLVDFVSRFRDAAVAEVHLHYGITLKAMKRVVGQFKHPRSLSLSDIRMKDVSQLNEMASIFCNMEGLKSLHLALVNRADELEYSSYEITALEMELKNKLPKCDVVVEFDQI